MFSKKISPLSIIWKNLHKSYKIHQNFLAISEDEGFKTSTFKTKQKIEKKILECILYIEINKKVPHKIVRKIDIKNVKRVFLINKLIVNKNWLTKILKRS